MIALSILVGGAAPWAVQAQEGTGETPRVQIAFTAEALSVDDDGMPTVAVRLLVTPSGGATEAIDLGQQEGSCWLLEMEEGQDGEEGSGAAPSNLAAGYNCWWAGAGVSFEAVRQGDDLVVMRAWTGEEMEGPLTWEEVARRTLPAGAQIVVSGE